MKIAFLFFKNNISILNNLIVNVISSLECSFENGTQMNEAGLFQKLLIKKLPTLKRSIGSDMFKGMLRGINSVH